MNPNRKEKPDIVVRDDIIELKRFDRSLKALCTDAHLQEKYPQKWIGFFEGEVKAAEDTLDKLLDRLDELNIPRDQTIVRFIETDPKVMILNATR